MCIPTTVDPTLAPEGRHIAGLFCQHFNPVLPGGGNGTIIATRRPGW
jgi:phytoene dehydrogenase-like protein